MSTAAPPVTAADLLKMPDAERFELVDGELVEIELGAKAGWVAGQIYTALNLYASEERGWAFPNGTGVQCYADDSNKVRRPDASFVARGRFQNEAVPDGHILLAPDLVVEVVSPNDSYYEVELKVDEYLDAGFRLVWVIDPSNRKVKVYRNDGSVSQVDATVQLSGEDVLPGFRCFVGDLFLRQAV